MTNKPLTWAQEQRVAWIVEMIGIYGFINRSHLPRKFRTSTPQAASDLKLVNALHPGLMTYDASAKTYRRAT